MSSHLLVLISSIVFSFGADLKPFHAHEVKPISPNEIKPQRSAEISAVKPTNALTKPFNNNSGQITAFKADEVKLNPKAGVTRITNNVPIPPKLLGTWHLNIPGVAYQTETRVGDLKERQLHTAVGATFGELTIRRDGRYSWKKNGSAEHGRLLPVLPKLNADPKLSYWLAKHGRDEVYIFLPPDSNDLEVFGANSNWQVAHGSKK